MDENLAARQSEVGYHRGITYPVWEFRTPDGLTMYQPVPLVPTDGRLDAQEQARRKAHTKALRTLQKLAKGEI